MGCSMEYVELALGPIFGFIVGAMVTLAIPPVGFDGAVSLVVGFLVGLGVIWTVYQSGTTADELKSLVE